jgi:hypothetical protein
MCACSVEANFPCHYEFDEWTRTKAAACWRTGARPDSKGRATCGCRAQAEAAQLAATIANVARRIDVNAEQLRLGFDAADLPRPTVPVHTGEWL